MKYAGIGSRGTPHYHLQTMRSIGRNLAASGYTLRSGGAPGADTAYELGAHTVNGKMQIFYPHRVKPEWIEYAAKFHPAWNKCDDYAKKLHARNSAIILGENLDDPVAFVSCWTQDGLVKGGTGQALRIAQALNIPIFNIFNDPTGCELNRMLI
jgi:hypothetical protein